MSREVAVRALAAAETWGCRVKSQVQNSRSGAHSRPALGQILE